MNTGLGRTVINSDPPTALVVADGEFDLFTTSSLTALLSRAVADGCREFRIDMDAVTFCDASTMGVLASLDRRLRATGGSLAIVGASTCVMRLLGIVALSHLLESTALSTS